MVGRGCGRGVASGWGMGGVWLVGGTWEGCVWLVGDVGGVWLVGECGWGIEGCVCCHVLVLYCVAAEPLVPAQLLEGRLQVRTHTCT